jgi:hypothetical protein
MRATRPVERVVRALQKRTKPRGIGDREALHESNRHGVRARLHRNANAQARIDGVRRIGRLLEGGGEVVVSPHRGRMNPFSVDRDLDLVRMLDAAHVAEIRAIEAGLELILAVEGKEMAHERPADRAERQPFDMLVLGEILPHAVRLGRRTLVHVTDSELADLLGRGEVTLLKRWRDAENVGNVVEAVRRIVGGQQRRDVHLEREEVPDRVGVLGAVQTAEQRRPGVGRERRCTIELGLE